MPERAVRFEFAPMAERGFAGKEARFALDAIDQLDSAFLDLHELSSGAARVDGLSVFQIVPEQIDAPGVLPV